MATDYDKKTRVEGPRSFAVLLEGLRDEGAESVNAQASEALQDLVGELRSRSTMLDKRLDGEITLKLKVSVLKGKATVRPEITVKKPKVKPPELEVWVTKGGNLTTEVPNQKKLPFVAVSEGETAANDDTAEPKRTAAKEV